MAVAAQKENATYYLDIPAFSLTQDSPSFPYRPRSGISPLPSITHRTYPASVKLTLLPFERRDFVWMDAFSYEVFIENNGNTTLTLPWSPDLHAFDQRVTRVPAGFRYASISLRIESVDGQYLSMMSGQDLYGSNESTGSLLPLFPGESMGYSCTGPLDGWWRW